ncbi:protein S-acyltransferase 11-like isoform X2 [Zingiber officinale]|uniref:protein S-acyltransferase 11-like isoform X2 n=1 Tax=Zingiber officinale TaxID=94328 RepID=UPI001C4B367B|nr:protein S-acyltransferase 11-like isoform X2 [Zingiber officinale]XP_042463651.1 protein S-acyltransferase 11-like isoform X2 [Zingiber officinale]
MDEESSKEEHYASSSLDSHKVKCWGCGLNLLLESFSPIFKCGWCGAITDQSRALRKPDSACFSRWRCLRDRLFVTLLLCFMLFVICAGVWAIYPIIFSISMFYGVFHCLLTAILSILTITYFCMASFFPPGSPPNITWGSYPVVGKDGLDNYTFCAYCSKPKPPRAHHCRSCRMCVLDMDHHCPFIGNCVGSANHWYFIMFLISVIISCTYVFMMTLYAGFHVWPPLVLRKLTISSSGPRIAASILKEIVAALASSALLLSARGLVLMYLAFASVSVEIGIVALLWQQLHWIYEGNTYINQITSHNSARRQGGCQNLFRFFGCPHSVLRVFLGSGNSGKLQDISSSKLL